MSTLYEIRIDGNEKSLTFFKHDVRISRFRTFLKTDRREFLSILFQNISDETKIKELVFSELHIKLKLPGKTNADILSRIEGLRK